MMMMSEEGGRGKKIRRDDDFNYSAAVFDRQDLLFNILLPFPARFLVTLKLVSKQFQSVISDPVFCMNHVRLHQQQQQSPSALYFSSSSPSDPRLHSLSLPLSAPQRAVPSLSPFEGMAFLLDRRFRALQSCNGLLLCSFDGAIPPRRLHFLCNPTTLAFAMLPELPDIQCSSKKSKNRPEDAVLTLAFNPLRTHVYKVFGLRIVRRAAQKSTCELMVYSSDEGGRAWRKSGCEFSIPAGYNRIQHGVFHDGGKITWICERGFIQFDAQSEKVIEVKKRSSSSSTWNKIRFFGEGIDGSLHLIKRRGNAGCDVYQLRPGTSNWELRERHQIRHHLWIRHGVGSDMYRILAVGDGGKSLILAIPGKVIHYSGECRTSSVLRELPQQQIPDYFSFACAASFQFLETLSPV